MKRFFGMLALVAAFGAVSAVTFNAVQPQRVIEQKQAAVEQQAPAPIAPANDQKAEAKAPLAKLLDADAKPMPKDELFGSSWTFNVNTPEIQMLLASGNYVLKDHPTVNGMKALVKKNLAAQPPPAPLQVAIQEKKDEAPQFVTGLVIPPNAKQIVAANWKLNGHKVKNTPMTTATSFDCRAMGWVSDYDNQGQCGSCWVFSGADPIACALRRAHYGKINVSKQQLIDCGFRGACNGGWPEDIAKYAKEHGVVSDEDYTPYHAGPGTCKSGASVYKIKDYAFVSQDDLPSYEDFKKMMVSKGVMSTCYASDGTPTTWGPDNGKVWKGTGSRQSDHAIKIVAFDDSKSPKGAILCWNQWTGRDTDLFWAEWGANGLGSYAMYYDVDEAPVPPAPINIAIAPTTATMNAGGTQQFNATVTGTTVGATWTTTGGTVTGSGLYTAPLTAGTYNVSANVAEAKGSATATATVTVNASPVPPIPPIPPGPDPLPITGKEIRILPDGAKVITDITYVPAPLPRTAVNLSGFSPAAIEAFKKFAEEASGAKQPAPAKEDPKPEPKSLPPVAVQPPQQQLFMDANGRLYYSNCPGGICPTR